MEPNYVGANKHIDAMAVAWLFAQDCVFFNPDEITWDGTHHGIVGAQINAEKVNDIPTFMENAGMYYQGIGDLLMTLEQDEELIVPRGKIHPGLHDAIREGDLTGITLFNLQACARAFQFLGDENEGVKRNMLEMAGLGDLADNPNAMACTYVIAVDQRLTRGIPGFYQLIRRMFEDMRAYNEIDLPYILLFTAARNVDADQCLDYFDDAVEGAVSETFHVETNMEEWKAAHGINDDDSADEGAGEEEGDERSAIIGMLRLLVLASDLGGGYQFPQDILDELERAENGDETVDVEDLARRMNELSPDQTEADPLTWTYNQGLRAEGPAFSVAIPDGYDIHKDVESGIGNSRPFIAVVAGTDEQAIGGSDQIVYVDHGLLGILSDEESMSMLREWGTVDLLVHLQRAAVVESYDMGVRVLEERLVPCVNGKCLVSLRRNFSSCEFYIMPMMFNSSAWLKVGLTQCPAEEAGKYMDAICELAKTVELVEPPVSNLVAKAYDYKKTLAPAGEIIETFEGLCNPMLTARKQDIESAHELFLKENPMHTTEGEVFSQAQALTRWGDENIDVLELLVDVYEAQQKAGMPYEDQVTLYDYLSTDFCTLYKMNLGSEGEPWDVKAKSAGVLRLPEGYEKLRERWEAMKPGKSSVGKTEEKASGANVSENAPSQEPKREKKTIDEPHSTAAIPRIEKALNEKVSASYFIETSEIAAGALMSARQVACDSATSSWSSDEDNVAAMAQEFANFNPIICRYYGYFVDALEAQVELGNTSDEIRKMADEVNEFSELVADRFSCGNAYLDSVANNRSPVRRPAEYSGIHARWQKLNSR